MILDDKYIKVNINNYEEIINYLKKCEYRVTNTSIRDYINQRKGYCKFFYIFTNSNCNNVLDCCTNTYHTYYTSNKTELNISNILREKKLKRILK